MIDLEKYYGIKITVSGNEIMATLNDSKASKDFISLLPLELTLNDYASTEKIGNLPRRLSTDDAPSGSAASVGDIAFYAPWGNLAIFYKNFRHSNGLIILGKIDKGIDQLMISDAVKARFELVKKH